MKHNILSVGWANKRYSIFEPNLKKNETVESRNTSESDTHLIM